MTTTTGTRRTDGGTTRGASARDTGPGRAPASRPPARLTVRDFCTELGISRSTFYEWRAKGRAPRCIKLPNGEIRIRRADFERWLDSLEEGAA
jgi:excisionase family DNA binding protein